MASWDNPQQTPLLAPPDDIQQVVALSSSMFQHHFQVRRKVLQFGQQFFLAPVWAGFLPLFSNTVESNNVYVYYDQIQ